jgi:hypothetical protein
MNDETKNGDQSVYEVTIRFVVTDTDALREAARQEAVGSEISYVDEKTGTMVREVITEGLWVAERAESEDPIIDDFMHAQVADTALPPGTDVLWVGDVPPVVATNRERGVIERIAHQGKHDKER